MAIQFDSSLSAEKRVKIAENWNAKFGAQLPPDSTLAKKWESDPLVLVPEGVPFEKMTKPQQDSVIGRRDMARIRAESDAKIEAKIAAEIKAAGGEEAYDRLQDEKAEKERDDTRRKAVEAAGGKAAYRRKHELALRRDQLRIILEHGGWEKFKAAPGDYPMMPDWIESHGGFDDYFRAAKPPLTGNDSRPLS